MKVYRDGPYIKATHVTGPPHNYLGLVLQRSEVVPKTRVDRVELPNDGNNPDRVDEEQLVKIVKQEVDNANTGLEAKIQLQIIQYVPTDSPREEIYRLMAKNIISTYLQEDVDA